MSRPTQSEIERYYFEQFRKHFVLPEGKIIYGDKPDVQIIGAKQLGIEIANLFLIDGANHASEQVQSIRRDQVLSLAQSIHKSKGGRSIELHIDFDPCVPITNINQSAEQIASLALQVQDSPITLSGQLSGIASDLRFVYHNGNEYSDAKWRSSQRFNVPDLDTARLTEVVASKTQKAKKYQPCDAYWLLCVVDFMDPAQDQELTLSPQFCLPETPFQRVLVYKPQFKIVLEVPQLAAIHLAG